MNRSSLSVLLLLLVFSSWTVRAVDNAALTRAVDALCQETGLSRAGEVTLFRQLPDRDNRYWLRVPLTVEGAKHVFDIYMSDSFKIFHFRPMDWPSSDTDIPGLGPDTVKEPPIRALLTRAVTRFSNRHKYKLYQGPMIQKVGDNFLVTYETISEEQQQKELKNPEGPIHMDPYVSFIVTPRGTVFGLFWGA